MTDIHNLITENIDVWSSAIEQRKTTGRGSSKKIKLQGVNKLRNLIVELALQGKLVEQDDQDVPARILIKEVQEKRKDLIKNKLLKRQSIKVNYDLDKKPFILPYSWQWSSIGELSEITPKNNIDDDLDVSFIPMPLVSTSYSGGHGEEIKKWEEVKKGFTHFANGDIGLAKITPCFENSKAAVFNNLKNGAGSGTTELHVARPLISKINSRYLLLFLKSPLFLITGESKMTGSAGQKRVPKDFFSTFSLPLAPSEEQNRIVLKVDELMVLCDQLEKQTETSIESHKLLVEELLLTLTNSKNTEEFSQNWARIAAHFDLLFTTEDSIEQLKKTILQLGVMGKLTPQNPSDEAASVLLERITKEKEQLVKDKKIKKVKELPTISEKAKNLPMGWEYSYFQNITKVITCGMASTPKYHESGKVFLSAKNVKPYKFMPEEHKFVDQETFDKITKNALPELDDILLTRVGAGIGEAALVDQNIEFAFYVSLTLIKPFSSALNSKYLLHWLNSPEGVQKSIDNIYGSGVSQGNLNVNQVRAFQVPIPPLDEQNRIVECIDNLLDICNKLKERIIESSATKVTLSTAIVEKTLG